MSFVSRVFRSVRRGVRATAKPAALVAVTGIVATSLVMTTPSNAQALVSADVIAPVIVEGAAEGVGGAVITGALVSNPIGWGVIAVTGIGLGLYATKDYWLSYNPGSLFFGDNSNTTTNPSTGAVIDPRVTMTAIAITPISGGLNQVDVSLTTTAPPSGTPDTYYHVSAHLKCNTLANGTGTAQPDTVIAPYSYYTPTIGRTNTFHPACPGGYVTGAIVGATGADPLLTASNPGGGPVNVMRVGNLVGTTHSGDPRGNTTTYYTTTDCINDQGHIQSLTVNSTGEKGGVKFPSCAAAGLGHSTGALHVDAFNSLDGTTTRVWQTNAPTVDPNEPLCAPTRPGAGCKYQISIDGKSCVIGDLQCENWGTVDANDSTHTRVSCQHGPYSEPLASCNVLEKAYFPGGAPATDANIDGNPATGNYTDPNGNTIPTNTPVQTGTVPGDAGDPNPVPAPAAGGAPSPSDAQKCWPTGWGVFNPVEWVYKPLSCFFVPQKSLQTRVDDLENTAKSKAPFSWMVGAGVMVAGASAGATNTGCPDWTIHVGTFSQNIVCNSPFIQAIVSSRQLLFGAMVIVMFWPLIRSLWYAAIPLVRPVPIS